MSHQIRILLALAACVSLSSVALAQRDIGQGRGDYGLQRNQTAPSWAVGSWFGRNDYRHTDVALTIEDNGRCSLAITLGSNTQTYRGNYRDGRLDIAGDRYLIRQMGEDLGLTKEADRRDFAQLRRRGGRPDVSRTGITLDAPRNGDRLRQGDVIFRGTTNDPSIQLEVMRGRDRVYMGATPVGRDGRFEIRVRLAQGHYDATLRTRGRGRFASEQRVSFDVGGAGRVSIQRPLENARLPEGSVEIAGIADTRDVDIEIGRGRDRVFQQRVTVRDGRFSVRTNLSWGHYVVTARSIEGGEVINTDRSSFDVGSPVDNRPAQLRIDRPSNRARIASGYVDFEGTTDAREVRIEIFREGNVRVVSQTVSARDGRFRARFNLPTGRYDAVVSVMDRGRSVTERRISFEMIRT